MSQGRKTGSKSGRYRCGGRLIGKTLGHYKIVAAIGAGGMGEVYRATDTKLGRDMALKLFPQRVVQRSRSAGAISARSARGGGAESSEHRDDFFGRRGDGVPFLTMELVEGQSLKELIAGMVCRWKNCWRSGGRLRMRSRRRTKKESYIGI